MHSMNRPYNLSCEKKCEIHMSLQRFNFFYEILVYYSVSCLLQQFPSNRIYTVSCFLQTTQLAVSRK